MSGRSRTWAFTDNQSAFNADAAIQRAASIELLAPIISTSKFGVFQEEKAPSTGTPHLQGFAVFATVTSLKTLKKRMPRAHWTLCNGSVEDNITYCSKVDTRAFPNLDSHTWGEKPAGRGKRTDLDDVASAIKENKSLKSIAETYPTTYIRYNRGMTALRAILQPKRSWVTECVIYWGPPGTFKTTHALEMAPDAMVLTKSMVTPSVVWFDGYDGHEDVIIDEFYGWIPFNFFLNLLDKIPMMVQTKGGAVPFVAKRIWITSNADPESWYSTLTGAQVAALPAMRRRLAEPISSVFYMGYGPDMKLPFCPCSKTPGMATGQCPLLHKPPNGPLALAAGLINSSPMPRHDDQSHARSRLL